MCVMSAISHEWNKLVPHPPYPYQWPQQITPTPQVVEGFTNEELRELVETYRQAKAAALKADELTGQPDCVDEEKEQLEERIAELERRLDELEK